MEELYPGLEQGATSWTHPGFTGRAALPGKDALFALRIVAEDGSTKTVEAMFAVGSVAFTRWGHGRPYMVGDHNNWFFRSFDAAEMATANPDEYFAEQTPHGLARRAGVEELCHGGHTPAPQVYLTLDIERGESSPTAEWHSITYRFRGLRVPRESAADIMHAAELHYDPYVVRVPAGALSAPDTAALHNDPHVVYVPAGALSAPDTGRPSLPCTSLHRSRN